MPFAFTVGLLRTFSAEHRLIGGDWGKENERHAHPYRLEVIFEGNALDKHGYLIDISVIEPRLDALCARYRGSMLNDLPEFAGKNPGIEQFAAVIAERLAPELDRSKVRAVTVKVWESDTAYATCRRDIG